MQNHRSCVQAVLTTLGCLAVLVSSQPAAAADKPKYATDIPQSITTPDNVETRLGTLKFTDGFPDDATVQKVYDNLDFQRGVQAFLTAMPAASLSAMRKGIRGFGPDNQTVIIFETLMDAVPHGEHRKHLHVRVAQPEGRPDRR